MEITATSRHPQPTGDRETLTALLALARGTGIPPGELLKVTATSGLSTDAYRRAVRAFLSWAGERGQASIPQGALSWPDPWTSSHASSAPRMHAPCLGRVCATST